MNTEFFTTCRYSVRPRSPHGKPFVAGHVAATLGALRLSPASRSPSRATPPLLARTAHQQRARGPGQSQEPPHLPELLLGAPQAARRRASPPHQQPSPRGPARRRLTAYVPPRLCPAQNMTSACVFPVFHNENPAQYNPAVTSRASSLAPSLSCLSPGAANPRRVLPAGPEAARPGPGP